IPQLGFRAWQRDTRPDHTGVAQQEARLRNCEARERIARVALDGFLEASQRCNEVARGVALVTALEIQVVRLEVFAVLACRARHLSRSELTGQGVCHGLRNLVLDGEHVLHLPVIALGPNPIAVLDIDELGGDSQALTRGSNASLEDLVDTEIEPD